MRSIISQRFQSRAAVCAAALLIFSGCQNMPKYKKMASGNFHQWDSYEGKHFAPSNGTVTAIDPAANTITIAQGKDTSVVYAVTPKTRLMHEGDDVSLAQIPINQSVKFIVSEDGRRLYDVWYGKRLYQYRPSASAAAHQRAQQPL